MVGSGKKECQEDGWGKLSNYLVLAKGKDQPRSPGEATRRKPKPDSPGNFLGADRGKEKFSVPAINRNLRQTLATPSRRRLFGGLNKGQKERVGTKRG